MLLISIFITFLFQQNPIKDFQQFLVEFEARPNISKSTVVASIKSCKSGNTVVEFNANKAINSASTLKLITTGLLLEEVGPNFQYKSTFSYSGNIQNGVLNGNIYLFSNGDPSLASTRYGKDFKWIAQKVLENLKRMGVSSINGKIIAIDKLFLAYDFPDYWAWNDMGNYFGAIPYQLNFNENQFEVYFKAGNLLDSPATLQRIEPQNAAWKIINQVHTAEVGSGDQVYMYSSPLDNTILLKGTVPLGASNFKVKGSIPNPPKFFAEMLEKEFEKLGLSVRGGVALESSLPISTSNFFEIDSPPLSSLIRDCNHSSINLYADAFLRTLGLKQLGVGTWQSGLDAMKMNYSQKGLNSSNLMVMDGSGLSPQGTITAIGMTDFLYSMSQSANFQPFLNSIPIAGKSGTVAGLNMGNSSTVIHVKSGTIKSTRAYAGYFYNRNNELMCFMVCVNRYDEADSKEVKSFIEAFLKRMATL